MLSCLLDDVSPPPPIPSKQTKLTTPSAVFVKARNRFQSDDRTASVGRYAFAFTWAPLVLLFMSSCLFLGGVLIGRKKRDTSGGYAKETAYNGNVGYPPGNQGFASDNVQSGYTANAPQRNIIREEVPEPTATTKGGQGMRGLFPRHREASVV